MRRPEVVALPEISNFFGIRISMFWSEHLPPHFHAVHQEEEALVDIRCATVLQGRLPSSKLKLVLAWAVIHKDDLLRDWELAAMQSPLEKIEPLR